MGEPVGLSPAPDVLQDLLEDSLNVVLCGMAAGTASAKARAYYAHKQNKFWKILYETGLTPALLQPHQCRDLLQHRIGLTDLVKTHSGMDHQIPLSELRLDARSRLSNSVAAFRPKFLAFTSKAAGQGFLGGKREYGEQAERIADTRIWILPSTSGAANGSWRPEVWHAFADAVRAATFVVPALSRDP
ncbi:mismatch-specific DNA-glycosylase [Bradyrhizobium sp. AUGA SZCCT0182]|uniref:mismatch-specific DNA-glycosylase n=1 Tax=Bradyrhizobium sp. AUGA SZCCT0182 TaxID=2807667 RepID=UPI001BAB1969|nr:mismatch-specific DNA-glycosylase [Bradyrhizobium sp. AUGA SZCCT0182]MBR1236173.1 mismatch-specific DNA-glycosylase [Bradyrhizobium sp. AUGA SZCCT0182]